MNGFRNLARRAKYYASSFGSVVLLVACVCLAKNRSARGNFFPRLEAGKTLAYQISYHSDKHVKTESRVIVAAPDDSAKMDVNAFLRLEVLSVQAQGNRAVIRARAKFELLDSEVHFRVPNIEPPAPQLQKQDPEGKSIE